MIVRLSVRNQKNLIFGGTDVLAVTTNICRPVSSAWYRVVKSVSPTRTKIVCKSSWFVGLYKTGAAPAPFSAW